MKYSNLVSYQAILKELSSAAKEQFESEFREKTQQISNEIMSRVASGLMNSFNCVVKTSGRDAVEVQFTILNRSNGKTNDDC